MTYTLPITKAREELTTLVENSRKKFSRYIITVKGTPAAVLMSAAEYDSLMETNEILADKGLMRAIRIGEKQIKQGKGIPWEKVKKELGYK